MHHQVVILATAHGARGPSHARAGQHLDQISIDQPPTPGGLIHGGRAELRELRQHACAVWHGGDRRHVAEARLVAHSQITIPSSWIEGSIPAHAMLAPTPLTARSPPSASPAE